MTYSIYEIIYSRLASNKHRLGNDILYKKALKLMDIWDTQNRLIYLTQAFDNPEYIDETSNCESYISLLMDNNLIFIEEVSDAVIMLNLIYYWLISQIKENQKIISTA